MANVVQFNVPELQGRYTFEFHRQGGVLFLVKLDGRVPPKMVGEPILLATDVGDDDRAREIIGVWRHGFHMDRPGSANSAALIRPTVGLGSTAKLPSNLLDALTRPRNS